MKKYILICIVCICRLTLFCSPLWIVQSDTRLYFYTRTANVWKKRAIKKSNSNSNKHSRVIEPINCAKKQWNQPHNQSNIRYYVIQSGRLEQKTQAALACRKWNKHTQRDTDTHAVSILFWTLILSFQFCAWNNLNNNKRKIQSIP